MKEMFPRLHYMPGDRFCPHHELQTITALPFVHVDDKKATRLEGLIFDRKRDMYFVNIYESIVIKVDMETKKVSHAYEFEDKRFMPTAVKIHKDGRLFVGGVDFKSERMGEHGGIYSMNPDGTDVKCVLSGWNIDDLVFDAKGGIYFTNYIGNPHNPEGSIEYITPDLVTVKTVVPRLAAPNGLALSTDDKILWVTETNAGLLHRITLGDEFHNTIPYKFEGFLGPDSCSVDEDDNLYVAMARQGRVLVFNPFGFLIAQVITPGCELGHNIRTTHPMVHPDRKELYITAADEHSDYGANIFYCGSFAAGHKKAYQFA
jgi:lactonase